MVLTTTTVGEAEREANSIIMENMASNMIISLGGKNAASSQPTEFFLLTTATKVIMVVASTTTDIITQDAWKLTDIARDSSSSQKKKYTRC